jgi:hypothetical protein
VYNKILIGEMIAGPSGAHSTTSSDSKKRLAQTLSGFGKDERLRHSMLPLAMHPMQISPYSFPIPMPMASLMPGAPMMHPMFNGMPMMQPPPMRALPILPNVNPENWSQLGIAGNPGMELGFAALPLVSGRGALSRVGGAPAFPPPISLPAGYWLQGLPSKQICDAVVKYYFEYVSWSHAVVVRSSLESRIKTFWSTLNGEASSAWVALYFMVLYHGISNMDPEDSIVRNIYVDFVFSQGLTSKYTSRTHQLHLINMNGDDYASRSGTERNSHLGKLIFPQHMKLRLFKHC